MNTIDDHRPRLALPPKLAKERAEARQKELQAQQQQSGCRYRARQVSPVTWAVERATVDGAEELTTTNKRLARKIADLLNAEHQGWVRHVNAWLRARKAEEREGA